MEAVISFKFYSSKTETEKEVTVDATKVIKTVNSEIDKYLKETNSEIYGNEEFTNVTWYKGNVEIRVQIKYNDTYFSVSEFRDFAVNGFKPLDEIDYTDYYSDEEI